MVGFRARSSVQRVAEPRYLQASCQRVSPEVMRIDVAFPPTLRFGATSRCGVVGRAIECVGVGTIRDGVPGSARVGVRFGDAKGMVASVRGYLLVGEIARTRVVEGRAWVAATSWDCAWDRPWDSARAFAR